MGSRKSSKFDDIKVGQSRAFVREAKLECYNTYKIIYRTKAANILYIPKIINVWCEM